MLEALQMGKSVYFDTVVTNIAAKEVEFRFVYLHSRRLQESTATFGHKMGNTDSGNGTYSTVVRNL